MNNPWIGALVGIAIVLGFVAVIWLSYTAVWIKSIATSLIGIESVMKHGHRYTNLERR